MHTHQRSVVVVGSGSDRGAVNIVTWHHRIFHVHILVHPHRYFDRHFDVLDLQHTNGMIPKSVRKWEAKIQVVFVDQRGVGKQSRER